MQSPVVIHLDKHCRSLARSNSKNESISRFLVGSQSPKRDNLIYICDYSDGQDGAINTAIKFPYGEVWHLDASDKYPDLFTAVVGNGKSLEAKLLKLPKKVTEMQGEDKNINSGQHSDEIESIFNIVSTDSQSLYENDICKQCLWQPEDGSQLLTCTNNILNIWDLRKKQKILNFPILDTLGVSNKNNGPKNSRDITELRWSSMYNCSIVAAVVGSNIHGIDTRISPTNVVSNCWNLKDPNCNHVLTIDFNSNSQFYLASGGDDCWTRFWDLRNTKEPAIQQKNHTHWVWSVRYNLFNDKFVLSSSSDGKVALSKIQSIASESLSYSSLDDEEKMSPITEEFDQDKESDIKSNPEDMLIYINEDHDDSVYRVEWATDPHVFASLGYESHLIINKVPRSGKLDPYN